MTGKHTTTHPAEHDVHQIATWIVIALMYLILAATLYLIWWKANPLWWA